MAAIVYTEQSQYDAKKVFKHEWGVVMVFEDRKRSIPWHMIQGIEEPLPEEPTEYQTRGVRERFH